MKKTKINKRAYICGKVTGEPIHTCALRFATAQKSLEYIYSEVINPIEVVGDFDADWNTAMRKCLTALMRCDVIVALPNSKDSKGAQLELHIAKQLGMKIIMMDKDYE